MPTQLFFKLNEDKQKNILDFSKNEFAEYGYALASTNRIIKSVNIAKGSLFKYFNSKEELYLDIIDSSINSMIKDTSNEYIDLPDDLFELILKYSEIEFNWYINNKESYKIIRDAFRTDNPLYSKVIEKYGKSSDDMFYALLSGIETDCFSAKPKVILNIVKWFLKSFNEEMLSEHNEELSLDEIKKEYNSKLKLYLDILKIGLLKKEN